MGRPRGTKNDNIGQVFVRLERDIQYVTMRYKKVREAYRKMKEQQRLIKRMGL